jgi:hypothetical protein
MRNIFSACESGRFEQEDRAMEISPRTRIGNVPVFCRYDDIVPIADILPNPRNPNRHPEQQIKMLALGKAHGNVLVFSNGDPAQAAAAIGTVETEEDLMEVDNAALLNSLLGGNQDA